jgi:PTH1 family peptidyl-tRNA hydrolase
MHLIVGLGNPGKEYEQTRHNAGFLAIEKLKKKLGYKGDLKEEKKFSAKIVRIGDLLLSTPTTFMNESGRSVRKLLEFYKMSVADLVVIHDDLDIRLGEYKVQQGVGPKVHNGIASVERYLKTDDFLRVRLGVDGRVAGGKYGSGADYVLSKMTKEEVSKLEMAIELSLGDLAEAFGLEFE